MTEYKVIYRSDKKTEGAKALTWEQGSPIFVEAIQVSRDVEKSDAFLQIKVRNITSQVVLTFKMTVLVHYENGEEQKVDIVPLDADIEPRSEQVLNPIQLERGDVIALEYKVSSVKTDKASWESQSEPAPLPICSDVDLNEEAMNERKTLLKEYGVQDVSSVRQKGHTETDDWWVCLCGTPNVDTFECSSCGLTKRQIKHLESESQLKESAEKRKERKAQQEIEDQQEKARKAELAKKGKKIGIIAGIIVAAVILIVILLNTVFANHDLSDVEMKQQSNGTWMITGKYTGEEISSDSPLLIFDLKDSSGKVVASALGVRKANSEDFLCIGINKIIPTPVTKGNISDLAAGVDSVSSYFEGYTYRTYKSSDVSSYEFKQAISSDELNKLIDK